MDLEQAKPTNPILPMSLLVDECIREFIGAFTYVVLATAAMTASSDLKDWSSLLDALLRSITDKPANCVGFGVFVAFMVVARLSKAHVNPAMTLISTALYGFPKRKLAPYLLSQLCGSISAVFCLYGSGHSSSALNQVLSRDPLTGESPWIWAHVSLQCMAGLYMAAAIHTEIDPGNKSGPRSGSSFLTALVQLWTFLTIRKTYLIVNPVQILGSQIASSILQCQFVYQEWYIVIVAIFSNLFTTMVVGWLLYVFHPEKVDTAVTEQTYRKRYIFKPQLPSLGCGLVRTPHLN